jgi:hypothetical protein
MEKCSEKKTLEDNSFKDPEGMVLPRPHRLRRFDENQPPGKRGHGHPRPMGTEDPERLNAWFDKHPKNNLKEAVVLRLTSTNPQAAARLLKEFPSTKSNFFYGGFMHTIRKLAETSPDSLESILPSLPSHARFHAKTMIAEQRLKSSFDDELRTRSMAPDRPRHRRPQPKTNRTPPSPRLVRHRQQEPPKSPQTPRQLPTVRKSPPKRPRPNLPQDDPTRHGAATRPRPTTTGDQKEKENCLSLNYSCQSVPRHPHFPIPPPK